MSNEKNKHIDDTEESDNNPTAEHSSSSLEKDRIPLDVPNEENVDPAAAKAGCNSPTQKPSFLITDILRGTNSDDGKMKSRQCLNINTETDDDDDTDADSDSDGEFKSSKDGTQCMDNEGSKNG